MMIHPYQTSMRTITERMKALADKLEYLDDLLGAVFHRHGKAAERWNELWMIATMKTRKDSG